MTRFMLDSTTAADIPKRYRLRRVKIVGAYVDGLYANEARVRTRFPKATVVTITVTGRAGAHVADCETGDLTPASAARWAKAEIAAGRTPTIYCQLSAWPAVKLEVRKLGIAGRVSYWIAHYSSDHAIPVGAVAIQHSDPSASGGHYDVSAVTAGHWPAIDPAPKPRRRKPPHHKQPLRPRRGRWFFFWRF